MTKLTSLLLIFLAIFFQASPTNGLGLTCAFEDDKTPCGNLFGVSFGYEMFQNTDDGCVSRGCIFGGMVWYSLLFSNLDCACD